MVHAPGKGVVCAGDAAVPGSLQLAYRPGNSGTEELSPVCPETRADDDISIPMDASGVSTARRFRCTAVRMGLNEVSQ